jgi:hypothetical protein
MDDLHGWIAMLLDLDRPVVAAVDGVAYGAGFSLALLADFIVASPRARCMPFMKVGLVPDCGALYTLPRVVGMAKARELVFSAREIGAEEARQIGAVFEIVPQDKLHARADELARGLAGASPVAFAMAKRALNQSLGSDVRAMLEMESLGQGIAFTTSYHREAVRRFKERSRRCSAGRPGRTSGLMAAGGIAPHRPPGHPSPRRNAGCLDDLLPFLDFAVQSLAHLFLRAGVGIGAGLHHALTHAGSFMATLKSALILLRIGCGVWAGANSAAHE